MTTSKKTLTLPLVVIIITMTISGLITTATSRTTPLSHAVETPATSPSPSASVYYADSDSDATTTSPSQSPSSDQQRMIMEETESTPVNNNNKNNNNNDPTALVKELCTEAENPDKCGLYFQYSKSNDPAEIVQTEIATLQTLVEEGKSTAAKVKGQHGGSGEVVRSLDACVESYDKADVNLERASMTCAKCVGPEKKEECSAVEVGEVKTMLSAVIANIGVCEEAFDGKGLHRNPMVATNQAVVELSDWLLEFSRKLAE